MRLEKRPAVIVLELQRKQLVLDRGIIGCPQSCFYHIKKLDADDMIDDSYDDGIPFWSLDDAGRAYLIEKNLIS